MSSGILVKVMKWLKPPLVPFHIPGNFGKEAITSYHFLGKQDLRMSNKEKKPKYLIFSFYFLAWLMLKLFHQLTKFPLRIQFCIYRKNCGTCYPGIG